MRISSHHPARIRRKKKHIEEIRFIKNTKGDVYSSKFTESQINLQKRKDYSIFVGKYHKDDYCK